MMLKPGKSHTNNRQAVFNNWKWHQSRNILDQSTQHLINYFYCSDPAKNENTATGKVVAMNDSRNQLFMDKKGLKT